MLEAHDEIIQHQAVVPDDWAVLRLDEGEAADSVLVPDGKVIVPLAVWLAQKDALEGRLPDLAVWLNSDERPETLAADIGKLTLIAVNFPKFTDGRGYSIAYNLRARLAYTGQLRAIGDVLRDQLFAMQRVGFDAFATRPDRNIHDALKGLFVFSETYQASWDQKNPLFRRHARIAPQPAEADLGARI